MKMGESKMCVGCGKTQSLPNINLCRKCYSEDCYLCCQEKMRNEIQVCVTCFEYVCDECCVGNETDGFDCLSCALD